jgi:hypothetical protein
MILEGKGDVVKDLPDLPFCNEFLDAAGQVIWYDKSSS